MQRQFAFPARPALAAESPGVVVFGLGAIGLVVVRALAGRADLGVNPGFVMDALPALLGSVCRALEQVRVRRVVDAARRRGNLQRKIGAGMTVEQFQAAADTGRFGHVGLVESAALLAEGLGWR